MWTYEQHPPRPLHLGALPNLAIPEQPPRVAIVTPSFNHSSFLRATIDSVLDQNYPKLFYHVQDGGSKDGTIEILKAMATEFPGAAKSMTDRQTRSTRDSRMPIATSWPT